MSKHRLEIDCHQSCVLRLEPVDRGHVCRRINRTISHSSEQSVSLWAPRQSAFRDSPAYMLLALAKPFRYWQRLTLLWCLAVLVAFAAPQETKAERANTRAYATSLLQKADVLGLDWTRTSWEKALLFYRESLTLHQVLDDPEGEALCNEKIGKVQALMGNGQQSLSFYERALASYQNLEDLSGSARTIVEIGRLYYGMEQMDTGEAKLEQGLAWYQAIGDAEGQARTAALLAYQIARKGEPGRAEELYLVSQEQLARVGDPALRSHTRFHQSAYLARQGQFAKALKSYRETLVTTKDRHIEARALINIGFVLKERGQPFEALKELERAAELFRAMDPYGLAACYVNMADIYTQFGERHKALDLLSRAGLLFDRSRNPHASILSSQGDIYLSSGDTYQALNLFQEALPVFRDLGNVKAEVKVLSQMGNAYILTGEGDKALTCHYRALQLNRQIDSADLEPGILGNLGKTMLSMGQLREALCYLEESLAHEKTSSLLGQSAANFLDLSKTYLAMGSLVQAEDCAYRALDIYQQIGNLQEEALTRHMLARIKYADNRLTAASLDSERALELAESLRAKIMGSHLRSTFFDRIYDLYSFHVEILMKLHEREPSRLYEEKALRFSERARARTLLEILNEVPLKGRSEQAGVLLREKEEVQQRLNGWTRFRMDLAQSNTAENTSEVDRKIEHLLSIYRDLEGRIRADNPLYAALTGPTPLSVREIQATVLDGETTMLVYQLGERNSYLWQVDIDGVEVYRLPRRSLIESMAQEVFDNLTARNKKIKFETRLERRRRVSLADEAYPESAGKLANIILEPIAKGNIIGKRLLIVADGALLYIPFGVLPMPGSEQPLIVKYSLVTAPSASVLPVLQRERQLREPAPKQFAVLADPVFSTADPRVGFRLLPRRVSPQSYLQPSAVEIIGLRGTPTFQRLPFTRQEAERIRAMFPEDGSVAVLGFDADYQAALSPELNQYQIIHFATHAVIDGEHPELSGLVFSMVDEDGTPQKGFLSQHEIFNMELNAEMVVLSACQTALGKELRGEGQVGLTQSFMYAGAPRVVASLWHIQDKATAELMALFYRAILEQGHSPTEALRQAQLAMWRDKNWRFPYHWGAFVSQGIWSWPQSEKKTQ